MARKAEVRGIIIPGEQRGRIIGFPTANIAIEHDCDLENVVSICEVEVDGKHFPAVGTYLPFKKTYEVHLLDWEGDLYGKEISIFLVETVRENRKFETQEKLIEQIGKDVEYAKKYFQILNF